MPISQSRVAPSAVIRPRPALSATVHGAKNDRLAQAILYAPLLGVTLFSKFTVPLGRKPLLFAVPLILGSTVIGLVTKRLTLEPNRSMAFCLMAAILTFESLVVAQPFNFPSLLLLLAIHLPHAFRLHGVGDSSTPHLARFLDLALFIAVLGIIQFPAQFLIGASYAFPLDHHMPAWLVSRDYNSLNVLSYGRATYKATGVFLLEPSMFSQLNAIAFGVEYVGPRRPWRLLCFCLGIVFAYSGTGIIVLASVVATLVLVQRNYKLLALLLVMGVLLVLLSEPLQLDIFARRTKELGAEGGSSHDRYVGGWALFEQYLWSDPVRWAFGVGAGMKLHLTPKPIQNAAETSWVKLTLEYGLLGISAYLGFIFYCVAWVRQNLVQRVSVTVVLLLGAALDPCSHAYFLSLLYWLPPAPSTPPLAQQRALSSVSYAVRARTHARRP